MTVGDDLGVDVGRATEWIVEHVPDVVAPLSLEFISGGRSNLTYRMVDAAGRQLVLRRPPLGNVLHTAHDMGASTASSPPWRRPTSRLPRPSATATTSP